MVAMLDKFSLLAEQSRIFRAAGGAVVLPQGTLTAPQSNLEFKEQLASGDLGNYMQYAEIQRIINMPIMFKMTDEELVEYNRANVLADRFERGFRMIPEQAEGAWAYEMVGGGFFPIGVGRGKTLLSLLIANKAFAKGVNKVLLCVPASVLIQLVTVDIPWARSRIPFQIPVHILGGKTGTQRRMLAHSSKKGLYIYTYSCLSAKDASDNLQAINPDTIILDEGHYAGNTSSARTKRLKPLIEGQEKEIIVLSGTITAKTIRDYYHLIRGALKKNNPLPNSSHLAGEWATQIDAQASPINANYEEKTDTKPGHNGSLLPLIHWAKQRFPEQSFPENVIGFRRAFKCRLVTAPGVVASGDAEIGTSLVIENHPVDNRETVEGWETLVKFVQQIEDAWLTPNGDEIDHAIHKWKWLYELEGAGFYNEMIWPTVEAYTKRKSITEAEARVELDMAREHHAAQQAYHKELRGWLEKDSRPGIDTPMLVGQDMARHGVKNVSHDLYEAWQYMKAKDFEGRPDRDSRAVRVCSFKIDAAVAWAIKVAEKGRGALLWVWHQEVGDWLVEKLTALQMPVLHCPAGDQHNATIIDHNNVNKLVVCSIAAHGQGKNLQHFSEQYFVQWPRDCKTAEQAIGRTHRTGQKADELIVNTNITSGFDELNFAACLNDALYVHQTTGNRQKLIYAAYNPMPKIFPSAVLIERGAQAKRLDGQQQALMTEKFVQEAA